MRLILLVFFCAITLTASAQFWQKKGKKQPRYDLSAANYTSAVAITPATVTLVPNVRLLDIKKPVDNLDLAEAIIMKEAKHHMRFRMYNDASYNFTDLAHLYVLQHRFSEAKWFLLQSNNLSRQQNNDKLTIANLLDLAMIKASIGEPALARTDLKEAHDMAVLKGMTDDIAVIEKETKEIELKNITGFARPEFRYAAAVEADKKTKQ